MENLGSLDTVEMGFIPNPEAVTTLEHFIKNDLPREMPRFTKADAAIDMWVYFVWCDIKTNKEFSRRLLVLSDAVSLQVRVCIEVAYQTFECDQCYHVERIGTFFRDEADTELEPLLRNAFDRMMKWQPTPENIWDLIQLQS